jgi:sensor histidine kinase YesM
MVFFHKRIYFLFSAVMSIPVWLACNEYVGDLPISEDEAVATGLTMCFFAGIFTGRYVADVWKLHTRFRPQRLIVGLSVFNFACLIFLSFNRNFQFRGQVPNLMWNLLSFLALSVALGALIKVVRAFAEQELTEAKTAAAHSESELRVLQSQLSPHFLFNTLNNMYGLSLTQHEKIPPLLLRLSDLLRYSVYGSNEIFVPLKNEVDHINNYIEFEKIRLGERLVLQTDITIPADDDAAIAPMLLIVFIENAFKHSKNTADEKIYIEIVLRTWNDLVLFLVKNSRGKEDRTFDKNSGFGLENVKKRLELLYPDEHKIEITKDDSSYSVMLHVKKKTLK